MYCMNYDSVKLTNYVHRFCIIPRVRGGVAEFTLLVQLVNNERAEVYNDTYDEPCKRGQGLHWQMDALMRSKCYTFQQGKQPREGIEQCTTSSVSMPKTLAFTNARATIRALHLRRIRQGRER